MKMILIILIMVAVAAPLEAQEVTTADLLRMIKELRAEMRQMDKQMQRSNKTVYGTNGRVVNQRQDAPGLHQIAGSVTLTGGVDTVFVNKFVSDGRKDIRFTNSSSYRGIVTPRTTGVAAKNYKIIPIDGQRFVVQSSDNTDTATVDFSVEGE